MTQIESIITLMRNDLNTRQLSKLQTVLETILKARHAPPPLYVPVVDLMTVPFTAFMS